ncbi:response regulator [Paraburkholderia sediminicola]|uniref:response regulator n=1 Tax=Paraburkholderia sediminicola TaxID=458836 RepID=UPI0038B9B34C
MNGWDVVWAPDGDVALAFARLTRPDLYITDWNMPGMDGPALCRPFARTRCRTLCRSSSPRRRHYRPIPNSRMITFCKSRWSR